MQKVVVSACLLGVECRYDGKDALSSEVDGLLKGRAPIPVCPEELGGLPTPRKRAEIIKGDGEDVLTGRAYIKDEDGRDVTPEFLKGAREVLTIAKKNNATCGLLKEGSPSCGVNTISKNGKKVSGMGVTTAILIEAGITTISVS